MNIERVKKAMKKKGMTNFGLAHESGISLSSITKYFRGERKPKIEQIQSIADALKLDIRELI